MQLCTFKKKPLFFPTTNTKHPRLFSNPFEILHSYLSYLFNSPIILQTAVWLHAFYPTVTFPTLNLYDSPDFSVIA